MTFPWTVRTFEPATPTFTQSHQRFVRYDVTAGHHHRRVVVRRLFLGHGTDEDRVEMVERR